MSDLPIAGLTPPPKSTRRLRFLAGFLLAISALAAASGATSIGLRISFTSGATIEPLTGQHHDATAEAVSVAVAREITDADGSDLGESELTDRISRIIDQDASGDDTSDWRRSIDAARTDAHVMTADPVASPTGAFAGSEGVIGRGLVGRVVGVSEYWSGSRARYSGAVGR